MMIEEGDLTSDRRRHRALLLLVPIVLTGSSILVRIVLHGATVDRFLVVIALLLSTILFLAYAHRWWRTRSLLKESGSNRYFYARGNIFRISHDLTGSIGVVSKDPREDHRILVLCDTDPPRLEAIPNWGQKAGAIELETTSSMKLWHIDRRLRSVEVTYNEHSSVFEGRGRVPKWTHQVSDQQT